MAITRFEVKELAATAVAVIGVAFVAGMLLVRSASAADPAEDSKRSLEKLMKDRAVFLSKPIDDESAKDVIAKLLFLKAVTNAPITLYINSPGGSVTAGLAIIETIESLNCEVRTVCTGRADSLAAIILASGTHGARTSITNAAIAFSDVWSNAPDSPQAAEYVRRLRTKLLEQTAKVTGQTTNEIEKLFVSRRPVAAEEAIRLGIIDRQIKASSR
ncbi:MAG TPA: ATP-dependent Clp protease proteolytic subunit [Verrucomicrobiae bacterium]|nr:ATP-dependent Clp protease proteolytic subunit [Verrucomicrobiae bacterium]